MTKKPTFIVYRNRFNEVKCYEVELISVSDDKNYTYVFDQQSGHRKTFKTKNIICKKDVKAQALHIADNEQLKFIPIPRSRPPNSSISFSRINNKDGKPEVCFTGFTKDIKQQLINLAELNNYYVTKSVTKNLYLLVCGNNAGPTKYEKASRNNVAIVWGFDGFHQFIETGEIGE